mmetsp:Transcript_669/g.1545  ORF Transcript_669/g.1545 Transcript_669/m.1545 type:complete len:149 (+) Transcript_669:1214-1660(+)
MHTGHPKSDNIAQFFPKPGRGTVPPELHRSIFLKYCKAIRWATCEAACAFRNQQAPVTADGCKAECQVSILRSSSPPSPKNLEMCNVVKPRVDHATRRTVTIAPKNNPTTCFNSSKAYEVLGVDIQNSFLQLITNSRAITAVCPLAPG